MIYTEEQDRIIEYSDLDALYFFRLDRRLNMKGKARSHQKNYFKDFMTMDIETSVQGRDTDQPISITYSIATYIDGDCILCRTWEEYVDLIGQMSDTMNLSKYNRLVCYVHNLPYEFQFMRNYFHIDEVFATQARKVVKCYTKGVEYRCSYKLTNMGLERFTSSTPTCKHGKLSGEEFDYKKFRTPKTVLTPRELQYIYNDVAGLYEALIYKMNSDDHDVATVPLTSTGYVRRELRQAMAQNPANRRNFIKTRLDGYLYGLLRQARRGGNTHCNPYWANHELDDIVSMDMSSAYPAVMVQCKFPMSKFRRIRQTSDFEKFVDSGKYACIIDIEFVDIKIKDWHTIPYIPVAKCTHVEADDNLLGDNGRLLKATMCSMVITDIDYKIIRDTYKWDKEHVKVYDCYVSEYDYLPDELRDTILKQYYDKTTLKDGDEYFYMKIKNKFNANFGCMLTDICQSEIIYNENSMTPYESDMKKMTDEEKVEYYTNKLDRYYNSRNSFLSYQHGLWVTAHCRQRLQKAIQALGDDMIYCDTDSTKFFDFPENRAIFDKLNQEIREEIIRCGKNCTVHYNGKEYTLGLWDNDGNYKHFKSMGAKKYCYIDNVDKINGKEVKVDYDVFHITVAGLSKSKACKWLEEQGGMSAFHVGQIVPKEYSGRTTALYNDYEKVRRLTIDGEEISVGSNMVITDTTYEFTFTKEYDDLLKQIEMGAVIL